MEKFEKEILVVDRPTLFAEKYFQGFSLASEFDYQKVIHDNYFYIKRGDAENNPNFKQPIAYAVIAHNSTNKIFAYQRAANENYHENRLRGKWSWGIGGHIDRVDDEKMDPIQTSLLREIKEEVELDSFEKPVLLGYINDDKTNVGQVHFGLLFLIQTSSRVKPRDLEISWGGFMSYEELEEIYVNSDTNVESWSEISLEPIRKSLNVGKEPSS